MNEIFVLVEHRKGQIRDITYEMLVKAKDLAEKKNAKPVALLLGKDLKQKAQNLSAYAEEVILIEDPKLENFISDTYQSVLSTLVKSHKPLLTMIGHTSYGVELAPRLAASLNIPLATDCIDFSFEGETLYVIRQIYGGKVNVKAALRKAEGYMVTVRQGVFSVDMLHPPVNGAIKEEQSPLNEEKVTKRFVKYVESPPSDVDITTAEKIVSIGRGVKDAAGIPMVKELAEALGAVLACSRPIVDKGWLPSDRQVGNSGKTVKPKLYLAIGISGAFQHVVGMKNSDTIMAINKDPKAPIFNFSDFAVVEDLFKVVPALTCNIRELKGQRL